MMKSRYLLYTLLTILLVIILSGCSGFSKQSEQNVRTLVLQAVEDYPKVEAVLMSDVGLFDDNERALLRHLAYEIRKELANVGKAQEAPLEAYQRLKAEYIKAIYLVEAKMPYMTPQAATEVQKHINLVRAIDIQIQAMLRASADRDLVIQDIIGIATVVIKLALAAGV